MCFGASARRGGWKRDSSGNVKREQEKEENALMEVLMIAGHLRMGIEVRMI